MECPEDPGCDSKSALCPCVKGDKTMDPCPYALLFSYSAQRQLSNLLKDDGIDVDEKIRKLSAAIKKFDDLAEALAPTPSADGRRSLLFGPLPPRDPCGQGFDPSCEQAQGFGMCGRADVWAACNVTCSTDLDTSGHHLHREDIALRPADFTKPILGEARDMICDVCKEHPEVPCCHTHPHPHSHRARDLGEKPFGPLQNACSLKMCGRGAKDGSKCGNAVGATIGGAASLFRRYLQQANEQKARANGLGNSTTRMRAFPPLTFNTMVERVRRQEVQVDKRVDDFIRDDHMDTILKSFQNLYQIADVQLAGEASILDETESQLAKQLDWTFDAVDIAQQGLNSTGAKMKTKLEDLQKKVEEHMRSVLISGIFTALFSVTELLYNPMGASTSSDVSALHTLAHRLARAL